MSEEVLRQATNLSKTGGGSQSRIQRWKVTITDPHDQNHDMSYMTPLISLNMIDMADYYLHLTIDGYNHSHVKQLMEDLGGGMYDIEVQQLDDQGGAEYTLFLQSCNIKKHEVIEVAAMVAHSIRYEFSAYTVA